MGRWGRGLVVGLAITVTVPATVPAVADVTAFPTPAANVGVLTGGLYIVGEAIVQGQPVRVCAYETVDSEGRAGVRVIAARPPVRGLYDTAAAFVPRGDARFRITTIHGVRAIELEGVWMGPVWDFLTTRLYATTGGGGASTHWAGHAFYGTYGDWRQTVNEGFMYVGPHESTSETFRWGRGAQGVCYVSAWN